MASKINKNKVAAAAQKYVQKGQYDKAIREYRKIVDDDPRDTRVWLKIGDLQAKKGTLDEAIDTYSKVAEFFTEQGFYLKAVAVYKQILSIQPERIDVNMVLAELYKQLGLLNDAMKQYEFVSNYLYEQGQTREALAALRQVIELDPTNVASRVKLAELYSREEMRAEAAEEFSRAADYLRAQDRLDDFIKVGERLVYHQPNNLGMIKELAQIYLQRNDARRSLQKLHIAFKKDPRDIDTLDMLSQAFHALGQVNKTISVLKEMARIALETGDPARRLKLFGRVMELDPNDEDAQKALAEAKPSAPPRLGRTFPRPGTHNGPQPQRPAEPDSEPVLAAPPPLAEEGFAPGYGSSASDDDYPAAVDAYEEPAEAEAYVEAPLPTAHDAAQATAEYDEDDDTDYEVGEFEVEEVDAEGFAVEEMEAPTGDREAEVADSGAVTYDPYSAETLKPGTDRSSLGITDDEALAEGDRRALVQKTIGEAEVYIKYGLQDKAIDHLEQLLQDEPYNVEVRYKLKDIYVQMQQFPRAARELYLLAYGLVNTDRRLAADLLNQALQLYPEDEYSQVLLSHLESTSGAAEAEAPGPTTAPPQGEEPAEELVVDDDEELVVDDGMLADSEGGLFSVPTGVNQQNLDLWQAEATPLSPEPVTGADDLPSAEQRKGGGIADDLEEADFFIQQSLFDEARVILENLLSRYPGHPLVSSKLEELEATEEDNRSQITHHPAQKVQEERLDEEVADALAQQGEISVMDAGSDEDEGELEMGDIFKSMGARLDQSVEEEDSETHYDLGIAYREMGLMNDAIRAFEKAMASGEKEVLCHQMIGLCHGDNGQYSEAINQYKQGLYVEGIKPREAISLYYELGVAYEQLGDPAEALYYYRKVANRDPRFRGVAERVAELAEQFGEAAGEGDNDGDPGGGGSHTTGDRAVSKLG